MQLEIRLRKILRQYSLDKRGITQQIAKDLHQHRHTIGKLYRGEVANPSLKLLGELCDWLADHGVPRPDLPQALFGARPSSLCRALAASGFVTLYVGEYRQTAPANRTWRWIAQHDALAMAKVVQTVSTTSGHTGHPVQIRIEYVPFRLELERRKPPQAYLAEDEKRAREVFRTMRETGAGHTSVLIGSQRANHLVELLVADVFGCDPFNPLPRKRSDAVPFYLAFREHDRIVPSCFGGACAPAGFQADGGAGIYYLNKQGWSFLEWKQDQQDAGVILVLRDTRTGAFKMAIFGFSGPGTEALAEQLLRDPDQFWPPTVEIEQTQVGVHVCRFTLAKESMDDRAGEICVREAKVIPVDREILEERISRENLRASERAKRAVRMRSS